ncbi:hypothetical protein [Flavobacterium sp. MDT1-60]|uniref:hypothetical protein n=1 Tax=Flavobacterium sp. MDT1-60 TaxID=1979344 RepID=UPI0017841946|nr:hypothetical protein [Flavobacterium sp. MDT1-60]QOG03947.1 hypothetical protein IHE43_06940 [Flavobacterium sp. MDT1-60]
MKQQYKSFEIEVRDEPNYIFNSVKNLRQYNKFFFHEDYYQENFNTTSKHAIIIKEFETEISNAIIGEIGGATGVYDNSFIIENDKIWICVCNKIYCLEIPSLELIWQKEFDHFTNLSIYKLEKDFVLHGELEILRITREGEIVWRFGGRDIWINPEGKTEFNIEDNVIRLFDFESNEYVLDFDGNLIEDNPRIIPNEVRKKWWRIFG